MNGSDKPDRGYTLGALGSYERIGTLIMDFGSEDYANNYVEEEFASTITRIPHLKEVWISDKIDAYKFIKRISASLKSGTSWRYWSRSDAAFYTTKGTVFIPESSLADFKAQAEEQNYTPSFTVKTYSGDVYSAQKAGAAAAKDICTGHEYTAEIMTADRIFHYETCLRLGADEACKGFGYVSEKD